MVPGMVVFVLMVGNLFAPAAGLGRFLDVAPPEPRAIETGPWRIEPALALRSSGPPRGVALGVRSPSAATTRSD